MIERIVCVALDGRRDIPETLKPNFKLKTKNALGHLDG